MKKVFYAFRMYQQVFFGFPLYFCLLFVNNFLVLIVDLQQHSSPFLPLMNCNNLLNFPLNVVLLCTLHFMFMKWICI